MERNFSHVIITSGPSMADPTDIIKLSVVCNDGDFHFGAPPGWRGWYVRFLVWAVRKHARKLVLR